MLVPLPVMPGEALPERALRLGVLDHRGVVGTPVRWEATARYLEGVLSGQRVTLVPLAFDDLTRAVVDAEVDLILSNPAQYVVLEHRFGVRPLATVRSGDQTSGEACCRFGAVVFARADRTHLTGLPDLVGRRVAAVHPESFGGYQMILREWVEAGLRPRDLSAIVDFLGDHDAVVRSVESGRHDAGVVRSGILESLAAERHVRLDAFRVLGQVDAPGPLRSTPLYPDWAMAALPHLPIHVANQVTVALLSMPEGDPAAVSAGIQGWSAPLNYQPVYELLEQLRLPPFDTVRAVPLSDLWVQYRWQLLMWLGAMIVLVLALVRVQRLNQRLADAGRTLQHRVDTRTRHLSDANERLEREIAERTRAEGRVRAHTRRQAQVLEAVDEAIFGLDGECRVVFANPAALALVGCPMEQLHGRAISQALHVCDDRGHSVWASESGDLSRCLARRQIQRVYDQRLYHVDGSVRMVDFAFRPMLDDEELLGGVLSVRDITGRNRIEEELRLHGQVFDTATEGVMITDARGRILSVNRAFEEVTGFGRDEVIGRNPNMLSSGRHDSAFYRDMWATLEKHGIWTGEIWNRRKDGDIFPERLTVSSLKDRQGEVTHYVGVFSDISDLKRSEQEIDFLARHDALTGLPNRGLFEDRLDHAISMAHRQGHHVGLLLVDLDRFRLVNDGVGHAAGDALLRETARRLTRCLRGSDTLARLGGDEFGVILEGLSDARDAGVQAERILEAMRVPLRLDGQDLFNTVSIGIAIFPGDGTHAETLLRNADTALALAKREGRNNLQFYTHELTEAVFSRLSIETGLRHALVRDELLLHYQPIVEAGNGKMVAMEALMRWQHPERGLVSPGLFIPVAEQSDLILELGRWAMHTVCAQLRAWREAGLAVVPVSLNIPARHFRQPGLVDDLKEIAREHGVSPSDLIVEITEGALMEPVALAVEQVGRLRAAGIAVAIDDFGTGYSSLGYLQRFHVNYLKLDRSFVSGLPADQNAQAISNAVMVMSHSLNLQVVAEGVETESQQAYLRDIGCDKIQGYLTGHPAPAHEVAQRLGAASQARSSAPGRAG